MQALRLFRTTNSPVTVSTRLFSCHWTAIKHSKTAMHELTFDGPICGPLKNTSHSPPSSPNAVNRPEKRRRLLTTFAAAPGQEGHKQASPDKAAQATVPGDGLWMLVGLGNKGAEYERTRHNIGFMVIDALAAEEAIDCRKKEKSAAVGRGTIGGNKVLLVKPDTYMNNSGEAVAALSRYYKVPSTRILVIMDDLDMPHASLRLRMRGGHGGHNGIRSIIEHMDGTQDFPRLKVGIGKPGGQMSTISWVLQDFTKQEMDSMQVAIHQSCDMVRSVLKQGLEKAMSMQAPKVSKNKQPTAPNKIVHAVKAMVNGLPQSAAPHDTKVLAKRGVSAPPLCLEVATAASAKT